MPPLITDTSRFIVAYARWIGSFRRIWAALAVVLVAAALSALIPAKPEDQIRYCGLALQLLGVGTVLALLTDKTVMFGRLGPLEYLRERFAARPRFRPRSHTISLSGVASATATGSARLSTWRGSVSSATVEERLSALEGNTETLRQDLQWNAQQAQQASEKLQTELRAERLTRQSSVTAVEQRLEKLGAGGLHIEAAGLLWLILGTVLATIPLELARLFGLTQ